MPAWVDRSMSLLQFKQLLKFLTPPRYNPQTNYLHNCPCDRSRWDINGFTGHSLCRSFKMGLRAHVGWLYSTTPLTWIKIRTHSSFHIDHIYIIFKFRTVKIWRPRVVLNDCFLSMLPGLLILIKSIRDDDRYAVVNLTTWILWVFSSAMNNNNSFFVALQGGTTLVLMKECAVGRIVCGVN